MTLEADIHRSLRELHHTAGRTESKVELLLERLQGGDGRHERLDKRVAAVEHKQAWYSGAAAAVGVIAGFVFRH